MEAVPMDLEQWEQEQEQALEAAEGAAEAYHPRWVITSLEEAQRVAYRLKRVKQQKAELEAVYDQEEARLLAELEGLRQRRAQALKPFEWRETWYEAPLQAFAAFYLRQTDTRSKSVALPAGTLRLRKQQPEWKIMDKQAVINRAMALGRADLVRVKYEPSLEALKKECRVQDGRAALPDPETGELITLEIAVTERPDKFEFEPS